VDEDDRVRENRLRRMARRQGLRLVKSRRRDLFATGYGTYLLVAEVADAPELVDGLTLDQIEEQLTSRPAPGSVAGRRLRD
jgi:hypothetical protein